MSYCDGTVFITGTTTVTITTGTLVCSTNDGYWDALDIATWDSTTILVPQFTYIPPPEQFYPEWRARWHPARAMLAKRPVRHQARACRFDQRRWKRRRFLHQLRSAA